MKLVAILALVTTGASAQVYQCMDDQGRLLLSDLACAGGKQLRSTPTPEERARARQEAMRAQSRASALEEPRRVEPAPQALAAPQETDTSAKCDAARRRLELVASLLNQKERDARLPNAQGEAAKACGYDIPAAPPPRERVVIPPPPPQPPQGGVWVNNRFCVQNGSFLSCR